MKRKTTTTDAVVMGATAGVVAANAMTILRMIARRLGVIEKTVPQAVEEWALAKTGTDMRSPAAHHVADQVLHLGYASMLGTVDGWLAHQRVPNTFARGLALGFGTWAFASLALLPGLGVTKPAWKATMRENAINLTSHLIFGLGTSLLTDGFRDQTSRGPAHSTERRTAEVG